MHQNLTKNCDFLKEKEKRVGAVRERERERERESERERETTVGADKEIVNKSIKRESERER